jgi:hypothetical protein
MLTDASGQPVLGTPISQVTAPPVSPASKVIGTDYRFVQALAMNSGGGTSTQLN